MSKKVTVLGVEYDSLRQVCLFYNKEYNTVKSRVALGWTYEEALDLVERNQIHLGDKTFRSKQDACRYYNVPRSTVEYRLDQGYSLEQAYGLVPIKKGDKPKKRKPRKKRVIRNSSWEIKVRGKTFRSKAHAARYYNIDIMLVYARENLGWTLEEALGLVPRKINRGEPIPVDGVIYKNLYVACKHYNLKYNTVYRRLERGWSIEEAFELVPRK